MSSNGVAKPKTNVFKLAFFIFMLGNASFFAFAIIKGGDDLFINLINATMGSMALAVGLLSVLIPEIFKSLFSSNKKTPDGND